MSGKMVKSPGVVKVDYFWRPSIFAKKQALFFWLVHKSVERTMAEPLYRVSLLFIQTQTFCTSLRTKINTLCKASLQGFSKYWIPHYQHYSKYLYFWYYFGTHFIPLIPMLMIFVPYPYYYTHLYHPFWIDNINKHQ